MTMQMPQLIIYNHRTGSMVAEMEKTPLEKPLATVADDQEKALLLSGFTLYHRGDFTRAQSAFEKILENNPAHFDALQMLGNIALQIKNTHQAIYFLKLALELNQSNHHVFNSYGIALGRSENYTEAIANYNRAIALRPDFAEAFNNRANAYIAIKNHEAAFIDFETAIALKPDYAEAYFNYGVALAKTLQYEKALTHYEKALALKSDYASAYHGYAVSLAKTLQYEIAFLNYEKALACKPDFPEAHCDYGIALARSEQYEKAIFHYEKAIALKPDFSTAHFNLSLLLLQFGQFKRGWEEYEWRDTTPYNKKSSLSPKSLWTGEQNLMGKTILIYGEQGLGDSIQFCRYLKLVSELGARILLDVPKPLVKLFKSIRCDTELIFIAEGSTISEFDYRCPLLSLPRAFKTEIHSIFAPQDYLQASSEQVKKWATRVGVKSKPRIGIAWSSASGFTHDAQRSVQLVDFLDALPTQGFDYFCLQKEIKAIDQKALALNPQIQFFGHHLDDFSETAALVQQVDLVISTCTSIPHLSGALGKPTWLMLQYSADWRWFLNRTDSPWYPSLTLYRQSSRGDWAGVFRQIKSDLLKLL